MDRSYYFLNDTDYQAVTEFTQRIRDTLGDHLVDMRLFGSKVRRDDTPESDIDIAVELSKVNKDLWNKVIDVAFEINLKWDVYVSPRVLSSEKIHSSKWRNTPFIKHIDIEGVSI